MPAADPDTQSFARDTLTVRLGEEHQYDNEATPEDARTGPDPVALALEEPDGTSRTLTTLDGKNPTTEVAGVGFAARLIGLFAASSSVLSDLFDYDPAPRGGAVVRRTTSDGDSLTCTDVFSRSAIRSRSSRMALPPISWPAWSTLVSEMGSKEAKVVLS